MDDGTLFTRLSDTLSDISRGAQRGGSTQHRSLWRMGAPPAFWRLARTEGVSS